MIRLKDFYSYRFFGYLALVGILVTCSIQVQAQTQNGNEIQLLNTVTGLNKSLNQKSTCTLVSPSPFPTPSPPPSQANQTFTKSVYTCSNDTNSKTNTPEEKKAVIVEFFHSNDNKFLGMGGVLFGQDGNDVGYTSGFTLKSKILSKDDQVITLSLNNELYLNERVNSKTPNTITHRLNTYTPTSQNPEAQGYTEEKTFSYPNYNHPQEKISVRLIDLTRLAAELKKGNDFYYKIGAGVELRSRKAQVGADIQDGWHSILGKKLAPRYRYLSPSGQQSVSTLSTWNYQSNVLIMPRENVLSIDPQTPQEFNLSTVDQVEEFNTPTLDPEHLNLKLSPYSLLFNAGVGGTKTIYESGGNCTLTAQSEVNLNIASEGTQLIGQNSKLNGVLLLRAKFHHLDIKGGAGLDYFFIQSPGQSKLRNETRTTQNTHFGKSYQVEAGYEMKSKNGNLITPFMRIEQKTGRIQFSEFNDADAIMDIGLRVQFNR